MANVFIGIIAEQYANSRMDLSKGKSRQALIAAEFRNLLVKNIKTMKSPSQYAEKLNYSLSHLNESVKSITGFPVSYWIHQQIALEAKRLLYYTDIDVKEIAFSLGYEDHTYFSRLFAKIVGIPPTAFRQKFHE
jgi:AraC-like DNA-binding protein